MRRRLPKREFAERIGKSRRTVERWISTGRIPNNLVFRDVTGHVYISESATECLFERYRCREFQNART